jgi:two-component system cell cycle sensor histidine kinase/response regulator CckA
MLRGEAHLYAPVLVLGTLLSLILAVYGWRRRHLVPGGAAFTVFNLGVALWTAVYILELNATGPAALFWANATYFGIVLLPASWLVFALRYSGHERRVTRLLLALLWLEPLATLVLAWTNPWHHWFRRSDQVAPTWEPGPAFWVHAGYSYALILAGTILTARRSRTGPRPRRGQAAALLIAALAPWAANAIYLSGLSPLGNLDPSPFGFVLTSLAVAWVLFRDLEQRLAAAERRFRALVDHSIDAIEVIDPETGRFLDVNEKACIARGYARGEYLALVAPQIYSAAAGRPWEEIRDEARRLGSCAFEGQHRRKDGSLFPVEVNATYISLDRDYVLAVVRDITERRRAGQALLESHSLLSAVVEGTTDAIYVKDREGRYLMINAAGARLFGREVADVIGRDDGALFARETADAIIEEDRRVMAEGRPEVVERSVTVAGVTRTYSATRGVCRDAGGAVIGVIGIARDVSEVRRLEAQFRQAQNMEAVGRLAGGVAHDFNNLLGIIIGNGDIVARRLVRDDPMGSRVAEMLRAAERAAALTRQLLAFSRQQVLQHSVLDLNAVVAGIDVVLRRLLGERIALVSVPGAGLGSVEGDQGQLQQVVVDLAVYARDAMPDGGQLRIETRNVEADEGYATRYPEMKPGPYVMLAVTDTGSGMGAEVLAHVFEPFFSTKELGKGAGLGLSTVYGIVEQSGGHIYVDSEVGVGTTFRIYLPRVAAAPLERPVGRPRSPAGGCETVLLAEDEGSLRELVGEILEESGYHILVACDGKEALHVAAAHPGPIHVMVTDVIMPGMSGREAADAIRQARPEMKVLYMSAYADDAVLRHGVPGSASFLAKPFTREGLLHEVRGLLGSP